MSTTVRKRALASCRVNNGYRHLSRLYLVTRGMAAVDTAFASLTRPRPAGALYGYLRASGLPTTVRWTLGVRLRITHAAA